LLRQLLAFCQVVMVTVVVMMMMVWTADDVVNEHGRPIRVLMVIWAIRSAIPD